MSCCPTNVARTLATLAAYSAADESGTAVLLQYVAGRFTVAEFTFEVETAYPTEGTIKISIIKAAVGGELLYEFPPGAKPLTSTRLARRRTFRPAGLAKPTSRTRTWSICTSMCHPV